MSKPSDFDIGPLTWVKSEIDQALERSLTALRVYFANPDDSPQLKQAHAHFHQAHGALQIVGLDGVTRLSEEIEALFGDFAEGTVPNADAISAAEQAYDAIDGYLKELLAGEPNQPLKLYTVYRDVAAARGREADPIDLYYPDMSRRPPRRDHLPVSVPEADMQRYLRRQRTRYQRGLLKWLRNDWSGVEGMRVAVAAVEAVQTSPTQRSFWWVALGVFDALAGGAVPAQPAVRRLCNRIEQQLKRVIDGSHTVAERLLREALFTVARAKAVTEHVHLVQEVFELATTIPDSLTVKSDSAPPPPALRSLRETVAGAKMVWNKVAAGHRPSLSAFRDHAEQIAGYAVALGHEQLRALTEQISALADWAVEHPERCDDSVSMEVATSLLLVESALENYARLGDEFKHQVRVMSERLQACINGSSLTSIAPVPLLDEMSRRAQERLLMSQVVAEIRSSLRAIEQALDEFFRDAGKREAVAALDKPVRQVLGALTMLNEDRAAAALATCATDIERFAKADYQPAQQDFERVAGALSGLGFYVEALQHGKADFDACMRPIGKRIDIEEDAVSGVVQTPERSVEAEIGTARRELERQFDAWRQQPDDSRLKDTLRTTLAVMQKDANLVADAALENRIGEMLTLLQIATAKPFDAQISQVMQNIAPSLAVAAHSPEAAALLDASTEAVDAELLAVYLEEADEVLQTIAEQHALAMQQPQNIDVMRTIRRGFHTLKGSGRMVGLNRLGEAAWAVEQVLNHWLEDERAATPDLLRLIEYARAFFAAAVESLKRGTGSPHENVVVALAEQVKKGEPLGEELPPVAADKEHSDDTRPFGDEGLHLEEFALPELPEPQLGPETFELPPIDIESVPPAHGDDDVSLDFTPLPDAQAPFATDPTPSSTVLEQTVAVGNVEFSGALYRTFLDEARSLLARLRGALAQTLPGAFGEDFKRATHTLNGIAGTVRISSIQHLGSALEAALNRIPEAQIDTDGRAAIDVVLTRLETMVADIEQRRLPPEAADIIAQLNELSAQVPLPTHSDDAPMELDFSGLMSVLPEDASPEPAPISANVLNFPTANNETAVGPEDAADKSQSKERRRRVDDDLDEQLLPIFMEEAQELVPAIGASVRDWRAHPDNAALGHALQRVLHTLKGSARMAGAMAMGELTHSMETRLENALALKHLPITLFDELENAYDRVNALYERLLNPEAAAEEDNTIAAPGLESAAPGELSALPSTSAPETPALTSQTAEDDDEPRKHAMAVPDEVEVAAQHRAVLRVRADTIDRLVNEAGEVSIARSRIEGEMLALKNSVHDLTENVGRLRNQLREIEIQAESQMQSKMSFAQEKEVQFDPLEFDRFTRFQELTRMMAESVNDVSTVHHNLIKALDEADAALSAQARMTRDLQGDLMRIRMVPFASVSERLYRVVRQATKDSGKRAVLDIRGAQAELDRSVLERITAPFEHMLRNCIAHGIESAAERRAAGKPEVGEIKVEVRQEGNEVMLAVTDDGAGLNIERIRDRAQSLGLIGADAELSDTEIAEFIFHPGFSTAAEVTQLAGRGVGMDVVKSEISALGGRVDTHTESGVGTRFTIFLPLTLAVTQAVLLRAGGTTYAVPSVMVEQIRQMKGEELQACHQDREAKWQDRAFPFRYLPRLLGDVSYRPEVKRVTPVLFARSGTRHAAIQVDEVLGNQEIVVKNTGPLLARIVGITGATVLGTGEIVLIINPVILASHDSAGLAYTPPPAPTMESELPVQPTVMIVDDSLTVRKITGRLLAREGYQVLTAKDGVDAMEQLLGVQPDVMLVDIEMPRMDGFDLTRNVRADAALKHIPIIMITSRTAEKHRNYAAQIGVNAYLGKPYQEDQLLEHIAALVQRSTLV